MNDIQRARMLNMIEKQRQGLQEPWIDPVTAAAGGFGGSLPSTLKALAGKTGLKALVRPFIAAVSGAAADYPLGKATEVVEDVSPALAMPFNIAAGMGSGALANKAIKAGSNVMKLRSMGVLPPIKNPTANELGMVEAWHGSPHKFDKFDSSKIGTGEGAQAFGHGLYFTDKESIARHYADNVKRPQVMVFDKKGKRDFSAIMQGGRNPIDADVILADSGGDLDKAIDLAKSRLSPALNKLKKLKSEGYTTKLSHNRNLYKVTINKGREDVWLDWDKPLSVNDSKKIAELWKKEQSWNPKNIDSVYSDIGMREGKTEGKIVYKHLSQHLGSDKEASLFLKRAGIDGIRYPTESLSGKKGSDKFNYVVFDENAVEIDDKISY
jgi:hypothetical protein